MIDIESFLEKGWVVIDLIDPSPVKEIRRALQNHLNALIGRDISLEDYHKVAHDDALHTKLQTALTDTFRKGLLGKSIIERQIPLFQSLLGLDLWIQKNPYLRIARPKKSQDNLGYHRDTFYGGSPYELSVLIPFVDVPYLSALKVMSGSHIQSEKAFPTTQIENPDSSVKKGSLKHQLGFLYAPKKMDSSVERKMVPIPLKVGQALAFSLSTVHGSIINQGSTTRWSTDIRLMNAFAPVDLSMRPDYYIPLSCSAMTAQAEQYFRANQKVEAS